MMNSVAGGPGLGNIDSSAQLSQVNDLFEQKESELRQLAAQKSKQLEQVLLQKDQKLKQQDSIIQALSKKLAMMESELARKVELTDEYENKFVQVREAVESEKMRTAHQIEQLNDTLSLKEKEAAKLEDRVKKMSEEKSALLGRQKELQWDKDQEAKRMTKEIARINERAEIERADHLQLVEKLKEDIRERYTMELSQK